MRRVAVMLLLVVGAVPLPGCQSKGTGPVGGGGVGKAGLGAEASAPPVGEGSANDAVWRPTPASVAVFPGTRFVTLDSGRTVLEARIEVLDAMGDPTKAAGDLRFELFAASNAAPIAATPMGPRLYSWDARLRTLDDQRDHYDPIIHGYAFHLAVDDPSIKGKPTMVRVTFQPVNGNRTSAQSPVRDDW